METVRTFLWFPAGLVPSVLDHYESVFPSFKRGESWISDEYSTADFSIAGQPFLMMSMDSGPAFNDSISIMVEVETQAEVDSIWEKLTAEGEEIACGWCRDKFGVTWQVVPAGLREIMEHPDAEVRAHVHQVFRTMKKIVLADLLPTS